MTVGQAEKALPSSAQVASFAACAHVLLKRRQNSVHTMELPPQAGHRVLRPKEGFGPS
jgi:hypothetical protein